jgi:hypothetical protein
MTRFLNGTPALALLLLLLCTVYFALWYVTPILALPMTIFLLIALSAQ